MDANGKAKSRQVQTGLANDQFTEIISGLQAGDKVVIPTTSTASTATIPGLTGATGGAAALGGAPGAVPGGIGGAGIATAPR